MKVVQINAVGDTGSTGSICKEINEALLQQGHKGVILYGNGGSTYEHAYKVSGKYEVKLHGLLSRIFGRNAAYSPLATAKILREIQRYQPDVVHLQNLHGNYVNLNPLLKYLGKKDIATVITLHDCWIFTGKCTHYTQIGCYKWKTGCHDCPKLKADIPSFFFDRTKQMWQEKVKLLREIPRLSVTGVSDWITEQGRQSPCFSKAGEITRVYNWIDFKTFYPRKSSIKEKYSIPEDRFMVLCIGAGWAKNASRTKELIKLAQSIGDDCQIVLAGSVPFAEELPGNIQYVGYIRSAEELAQLYSAADVYVHLSREDTFGKVIAEAMACGTPAVVYDATACPEIVEQGCGYVVEAGNTDLLLDAIYRVKEKGKESFSQACIESGLKRFSKEDLLAETIGVYKRVCQRA